MKARPIWRTGESGAAREPAIFALGQMRRCRTGLWFEHGDDAFLSLPEYRCAGASRFTDNASEDEDHGEIYERVTCTACGRLHMVNLRTGKILGVRQSPIAGSDVAGADE